MRRAVLLGIATTAVLRMRRVGGTKRKYSILVCFVLEMRKKLICVS
jgi:hypothetical protein